MGGVLGCRLPRRLEKVGANDVQIHQPSRRNSNLSPLGNRGLSNAKHPGHSSRATKTIDLFGVRMYVFHTTILAIAKAMVNSHG